MRSNDKHLVMTPYQLQEVLEAKLNTETRYFHDVGSGVIFAHKNMVTSEYEHPLVDVYALTGFYSIEVAPRRGKELVEFNITSGHSRKSLEYMYKDRPDKLERLDEILRGGC